MKVSLGKKIKLLTDIRHAFKKQKFVLDESKADFGADKLTQLKKVKNTSEVKGYPFRFIKAEKDLSLKILPIETKYEKREHPCYIENIVLKELTDNIILKGISPHITYYIGSQKVSNKCKALEFLNLRKLEIEDKIKSQSNMLISEYVSGGSLNQWVFDVYEKKDIISDNQWKSIVFQLLYTISVLQYHYRMMHNDFHYGNILIDDSLKPGGYFVYNIGGEKYYIKNTGVIPKLWDFEFSMVYSDKIKDYYPNKFITGSYIYDKKNHRTLVDKLVNNYNEDVPYNYNTVYDVHYFLTSLLDLYISQELFDWIMSIYPEELIPDDESTNLSSKSVKNNSTNFDSSELSSISSISSIFDTSSASYSTSSTSIEINSNTSSSSSSNESTSNKTESTESTNKSIKYLKAGRMLNGVENNFDLPDANVLIKNNFFESFKIQPEDFDSETAIYLNAGF